jgi:hypothetical protein
MSRSLGGQPTLGALALLAGRYRPQPVDRDTARVAAHELAGRGMLPRDIAAALGLTETAVRGRLEGAP